VLEAVGIGLATTETELLQYMKSTLLWQQNKTEQAEASLKWLIAEGRFAIDFLVYNEILSKMVQ